MPTGKKHRLEGESETFKKAKKTKTKADDDDDDDAEHTAAKVKKDKKSRKEERKEKKEKRKKERKNKDALVDAPAPAVVPADVPAGGPASNKATKEDTECKKLRDHRDKKKSKYGDGLASSDMFKPKPDQAGYQQTAAVQAVPESEIDSFLEKNHISIDDPTKPSTPLRPILTFDQLMTSPLPSTHPFANFTKPTPIQSASWPYSLSGRDVIGIAETGSGKTHAFSLPCVQGLSSTPRSGRKAGPTTAHARAVIVSPTRELTMQTHASISSLTAAAGLSAVCLYGGASKDDQRSLLRKGADIIVATPGRLKDFLSEACVSLSDTTFLVLDEADRMLDKGFENDIKLIIGSCAPKHKRQTLMFTATWPDSVRDLAESFMVDPVKVIIGKNQPSDRAGTGTVELQANSRIEQTVEVVDPWDKERRLLALLKDVQRDKAHKYRILVFCLYKKETTRVEQFLVSRGVRVCTIHGDLRQEQRTRSIKAFKSGSTTVMLATDVAARGLDIPNVKLVVNLTFPLTIEDYVHRIGRTGRAGKEGRAITFFTERDKAHSGSLINLLRAAGQTVPEELLKFGTTVKKKEHDAYGAFFKDIDMTKKATKITFD